MRRRMDERPFGVLGQAFEARSVYPASAVSSSSRSDAVPVHDQAVSQSAFIQGVIPRNKRFSLPRHAFPNRRPAVGYEE